MLIATESVISCAGAAEDAASTKTNASANRTRRSMMADRIGASAAVQHDGESILKRGRRQPARRSERAALLDGGQRPVHQEDQHEQQERERDRDVEVSLA